MWALLLLIWTLFFQPIWNKRISEFWEKKILDPKSPLHYKKLIERMVELYYTLLILIVLYIMRGFKGVGLLKFTNKETERNAMIGIGLLTAIFIIAKILERGNERKSFALMPDSSPQRKNPFNL